MYVCAPTSPAMYINWVNIITGCTRKWSVRIEWSCCGSTWEGRIWRFRSSCMITTVSLNTVLLCTSTWTMISPVIILLLSCTPISPSARWGFILSHTPFVYLLHSIFGIFLALLFFSCFCLFLPLLLCMSTPYIVSIMYVLYVTKQITLLSVILLFWMRLCS